ncbi:MAG: PAS domain S-box protein, partial [Syntrophorhabdaceae bacterium]|nr:PAS domain S-box protein [Syntrophorhabdaceae bacterium]
MAVPLRVLIIEDSDDDAVLIAHYIERGGYSLTYKRVETRAAMIDALDNQRWDLIVSDYKLPGFNGMTALKIYKERGLDIPFIIVSGTIGEDIAVEAMISGAHDYVMKNNLARLLPAIQRELREAEVRRERSQTQKALKESEERYRNIIDNAINGIYQTTKEGRFLMANRAFVEMLGYESFEEMQSMITDIAHQLYVNPEDRIHILEAIEKEGFIKRFETQFYKRDRSKIWVSINMRSVFDREGNFLYYEGIDEDITPRKFSEERLHKILSGTIQALSFAVETRDPFTSGHQKKVATLARALSKELKLRHEVIDNIHIAAQVHDIGKISIPAEILSRPGKLSQIEMNLIKAHPQTGYDILKKVDLPYPIAEMVLQHHERLDGSGYPHAVSYTHL